MKFEMRLHALIVGALLGLSLAADPCRSGQLGDLANLYDYPPAVSYCTANRPRAKPVKRDAASNPYGGKQAKPLAHGVGVCPVKPPRPVATKPAVPSGGQTSSDKAAAFSSLLRESKPLKSNFCSCALQSNTVSSALQFYRHSLTLVRTQRIL